MDRKVRSSFQYASLCIGVHIYDYQNWDSMLNVSHAIFNVIIGISTFIFTTGSMIVYTEDVVIWIEGICIWLTGVNALTGIVIVWIYRKQFRKFLEEMAFKDAILDIPFVEQVVKSSCEEEKLKELKNMVFGTQNTLHMNTVWHLKAYSAGVLSTSFLYIVDTIYQMIATEEESLRLLAFNMWFPWKIDDLKVYITTFIFNVYAGFISAMCYPGFQSIIIILMGQIIRHLDILTYILSNLDDLIVESSQNNNRNDRWQIYCSSVLSQCIDHYIFIKKFCCRLNAICRIFYLILIIDAMMLVCVCSVKIAISHGMSHDLIKYCLHEFFFTLVVLQFCVLGQQVQNECEKFEYAVTEKWYIFNKKHRDNIKIFHFAVNQKMPIPIFGSISLSLPTFTWFVKSGMSFFTLAMSVLED